MLEKKVESIAVSENKTWSVGIGEAILAIRDKNWNKLESLLDVITCELKMSKILQFTKATYFKYPPYGRIVTHLSSGNQ